MKLKVRSILVRARVRMSILEMSCIFFFFFLILKSLRRAAYQADILGTASRTEMADVEQMKKIVPLITCEVPFVNMCELVFGVGSSELILSNNQSKATLCFLYTCLTVGLRPLILILITASLSSKTFYFALEPEHIAFDGT